MIVDHISKNFCIAQRCAFQRDETVAMQVDAKDWSDLQRCDRKSIHGARDERADAILEVALWYPNVVSGMNRNG